MQTRMNKVSGASALVVPLILVSVVASPAHAEQGFQLGADGTTKPVYEMSDAVIEHVYVETRMDSDLDGRLDLVRADIVRPNTPSGVTIPAILTASGYNGTPPGYPYVDDENRDTSDLSYFPGIYDNYFVPRGFAYISIDVAGTNWSEGCVDNVGPNDVESVAAVIRWLHHEPDSKAYRQLDRKTEIGNPWSSGRSAVTGISYDGGITNAVATAPDVPGLETIVPIAGGTSAYNTRPNGVYVGGGTADFSEWLTEPEPAGTTDPTVPERLRQHQAEKHVQCQSSFDAMRAEADPVTRNYNDFWDARNYTNHVDQIAANGVSVFTVVGQGDMIVRTNEFDKHWAAMNEAGVETKLWMHLRGHVDPFTTDQDAWMDTLHRWYDNQLLDVDNGITGEPAVHLETTPNQWDDYTSWPVVGSTPVSYHLDGGADQTVGNLVVTPSAGGTPSFTGGQLWDATPFELTDKAAAPAGAPDRLVYASKPLEQDTHISGTTSVSLRVKPDAADTNISAALIDYGGGTYVNWDTDARGIQSLPTSRVWGSPTAQESAIVSDTSALTADSGSFTITRGTANTAHYESIRSYTPAPTDEYITLTWDLYAADHILPAGHQLGVIIYNNTIQLDPGTVGNYVGLAGATVDLTGSTITIPIVRQDGEVVPEPSPTPPSLTPGASSSTPDGESPMLAKTGASESAWLVVLAGMLGASGMLVVFGRGRRRRLRSSAS